MRDFIAKIFLTALLVLTTFSAIGAEKVTFEANSPLTVIVGETFRVEFALNANPESNTFKAPAFEGFDVLAGPAEATGQSMQIINNSVTRSVSYTYTYVISAQKAGNLTVGAAEVKVDGTLYRTKPLTIEVVDEGATASNGGGLTQQDGSAEAQSSSQGKIAKDDILLRAIVSRTSVFKGEPLRVTFKLYERVPVVSHSGFKVPSFNGFWAQNLITTSVQADRETYNGKVYQTIVAAEYLLYPQQAGTLVIDPAEITATAQVVVQNKPRRDAFFFDDGREILNIPRLVQSQRISVTVKPLPEGAPASFNGAVGNFTMDASLPRDVLAANSADTYTIKISGTGNLAFVQAPKLTLPTSFEQYNVKTTESINPTAAGSTGYRQFEYPFIARAEGNFNIEPVEFSYFDPGRMKYMTLRSRPYELEITHDANESSDAHIVAGTPISKEGVKMLGQDIRFIKLGGSQLRAIGSPFLFSIIYWVLLFAILALFTLIYIALRKQIRESQNVALLRGKRANKVAVQRFRTAKRYMEQQDKHAFYEEMLRALWGYMGDKFNIPVANLTKENVREELAKRGVSADETQRFTSIITKCDEAQYSPAASAQMSEVYAEGVDLISRIEAVIKR